MKLVDTDETIVLVTGTSIPAEEKDRPLAYRLKTEIDRRGAGHAYRRAVVVGDGWYLANRIFHLNPTIAIGGPGANGLAREFASDLPIVWHHQDQAYLQAEFDGESKRAVLWGMSAETTSLAVDAFVDRGVLEDLLGRIWRFPEELRA